MRNRITTMRIARGTAVAAALLGALSVRAQTQFEGILEEITVTAQRREELLEDVPISISTMQGEDLSKILQGGEDARALAGRIPGLNAE